MNERIKELYAEACKDLDLTDDILKKFAELIVKECLHVLKLAYSEGNEDAYSYDDALDHAEYNIKQHFGVEE